MAEYLAPAWRELGRKRGFVLDTGSPWPGRASGRLTQGSSPCALATYGRAGNRDDAGAFVRMPIPELGDARFALTLSKDGFQLEPLSHLVWLWVDEQVRDRLMAARPASVYPGGSSLAKAPRS